MPVICEQCGFENSEIYKYCNDCGAILPVKAGDLLLSGVTLGDRYEIIELIKSGGMGAVYKGLDKRLGEACAIKEMIGFYEKSEERDYVLKSFHKEAKLLASLRHESLPRVTDHFMEHGKYYLIMDFIDGKDLEVILKSEEGKGLPEDTVVSYSLEILKVLNYLHTGETPIVYRDLKPSNIMIRNDTGQVVLVDFGIARIVHKDSDTKKTPIGTEGYIAPEQYTGKPEPGSDIYSLGATMHHLLTGIQPVIPFQFKPLKEIKPDLSPELCNAVVKALQMKPEDRFSSAKDMLDYLTGKTAIVKEESDFSLEICKKITAVKKICGNCEAENEPGETLCYECGSIIGTSSYRSTDFSRGHYMESEVKTSSNEWTLQKSGIMNDLRGVSFVDPLTGWVVGSYGTILHTTDGGKTWNKQISGLDGWLYDVDFFDRDSGVAAGLKGIILYTTDGGNTWNRSLYKTDCDIYSVHYCDPSSIWLAGDRGFILNSNDGGESWNLHNIGTDEPLADIYFLDNNNGWVAGKHGTILRYLPPVKGLSSTLFDKLIRRNRDINSKWVFQSNRDIREDLYCVHFIDSHTGWAGGINGTILHTKDGGIKWYEQSSGSRIWIKGIYFVNHLKGWAVGSGGNILYTADGGGKWRIQNSGTSAWLSGIEFLDFNTGWVVGGQGSILKYSPQGSGK